MQKPNRNNHQMEGRSTEKRFCTDETKTWRLQKEKTGQSLRSAGKVK